jgi:hypothetical protein
VNVIMDFSYSDPPVVAFIVIPALLVVALVWGTAAAWRRSGASQSSSRRIALLAGAAAVAWMAATWVLAESGLLRNWDRTPPPFGLFILVIAVLAVVIAFSPFGRRLALFVPLWALVAVQAFRLPLELAMHAMFERGIMPEQMSYSGRNFRHHHRDDGHRRCGVSGGRTWRPHPCCHVERSRARVASECRDCRDPLDADLQIFR